MERGCIVLMCGLPGAGKSTFARSIVQQLESVDGAAAGGATQLQVCFSKDLPAMRPRSAE